VTAEINVAVEIEDRALGRSCDGCTMSCRVLRIAQLEKKAGELCRNARPGSGCAIYPLRPTLCRTFACRWASGSCAASGSSILCCFVWRSRHSILCERRGGRLLSCPAQAEDRDLMRGDWETRNFVLR
jgi:hypothetical protein